MQTFFIMMAEALAPAHGLAVIAGMDHPASFENLRALLTLARELRTSAAQTSDITYIGLFLKTARALEERADRLASPAYSLSGPQRR